MLVENVSLSYFIIVEPGLRSKEHLLESMMENPKAKLIFLEGLGKVFDYSWVNKYAAKRISFSYQDSESLKNIENMLGEMKIRVSGVVCYTEPSVSFANRLSHLLGCPTLAQFNDTQFNNKLSIRKLLELSGLCQPAFIGILHRSQLSSIPVTFPVIMKPAQMTASMGVYLCNSREDLETHFDECRLADFYDENLRDHFADISNEVLIEEYIDGQEYSAEIVVCQNKPTILGVTFKETTTGLFRDEVGHTFPHLLPVNHAEKLSVFIESMVKTIGWSNTFLHLEFKIKDDEIMMIEVNSRIAGDYIPKLVEDSLGFNIGMTLLEVAEGRFEGIGIERHPQRKKSIQFLTTENEGRIRSLKVAEGYESRAVISAAVGDILYRQDLCGLSRLGYMFTDEDIIDKNNFIQITTDPIISASRLPFSTDTLIVVRADLLDLDTLVKLEGQSWKKFGQASEKTIKDRLKSSRTKVLLAFSLKEQKPVGFITLVGLTAKEAEVYRHWEDFNAVSLEHRSPTSSNNSWDHYHILSVSVSEHAPKYSGSILIAETLKYLFSTENVSQVSSGFRLSGYQRRKKIDDCSIDDYLLELRTGISSDPMFKIASRTNALITGVIKNYWDDPESENNALLVTWTSSQVLQIQSFESR